MSALTPSREDTRLRLRGMLEDAIGDVEAVRGVMCDDFAHGPVFDVELAEALRSLTMVLERLS